MAFHLRLIESAAVERSRSVGDQHLAVDLGVGIVRTLPVAAGC